VRTLTVAVAGNPNCGKTTLFNALTGSSRRVANWPGVTVERAEGSVERNGVLLRLVDLPGMYSLKPYSLEEQVARRCLLEDPIDVIVNVADACHLERSLYLTLELAELGKPVVLALNMMDAAKKQGLWIDTEYVADLCHVEAAVPVSARRRLGLEELTEAVVRCAGRGGKRGRRVDSSKGKEGSGERQAESRERQGKSRERQAESCERQGLRYPFRADSAGERYTYIEEIVAACVKGGGRREKFTDQADRVLTHPIWGIPLFLGIMAAVFFLTFTVGDWLKGYFGLMLSFLREEARWLLEAIGVAEWLNSLIVDGILAGVGSVLTFLPNLVILFAALAVLEDSGYMARAAYIMDSIMGRAGLSGKAFLPMVLGFGCTVPAVLAARTLERQEDRRRTIFITPFMSCSARLPVYVLFARAFFPRHAMAVVYGLYVLGLGVAVAAALVWRRAKGGGEAAPLLIELPDYRLPDMRTAAVYVREKTADYLNRAGTTIFLASVILWFLLHYSAAGPVQAVSESLAAGLGRLLAPLLAPAGLGQWQVAVALLGGLSAKEVVVSSLAVMYGLSDLQTPAGLELFAGAWQAAGGMGSASAAAFLVFCLLYSPCAAALAAIRRESGSLWWTVRMALFQTGLAWVMAVCVYQAGKLAAAFF